MGLRRQDIIDILDGTHPRIGRGVAFAIYGAIVVSAIIIAIETMPGLAPRAHAILLAIEIALLAAFTLEYLCRIVCAQRPLAYVFSFWGLVDFVAIVPAIIFLVPDFVSVRALRLIRLMRLLKLLKATRAMDRLARMFEVIRTEFFIFLFFAIVALYLSAVGIYHFEHEAQPETFGSIPQSLWWAAVTLTTVGYGDAYPITLGGRIFTGLTMLVGVGIVALPAGLIATAMAETRPPETQTEGSRSSSSQHVSNKEENT